MAKKFWPKGVMPALITPFTKNFEVNEAALRQLIDFVIEKGVTGVVPCGTTGEFVNLTVEERKRIIDITVDQVNGRVPVIAGTGDAETEKVIKLTRYAEDAGADAALIVSPYYLKPMDKEVFEHYERIARAVDLPILLYNIPQVTGMEIPWWVVEGLAEIDNIVGIKDSSGNMSYMMALFEKVYKKISIICGHDEIAMAALAVGADGLILASANLIPDIWLQIYDATRKGDLEKALHLQRKVQTLTRIITGGGALAVKAGLRMMGFNVGTARRPLIMGGRLRYENEELLRLHLEWLGKIPKKTIEFEIEPGATVKSELAKTPKTPPKISDFTLKIGEGFASPSTAEVAHIDIIIGLKNAIVGKIIQEALEKPIKGHEPKIVEYDGKPIEPTTLLVPTVTIRNAKQAEFTYNYAMKGLAKAVKDSVENGMLPKDALDKLAIIAKVFVHPTASNPTRVTINNYKAALYALRKALEARPTLAELLEGKDSARHEFRYEP